MTITASGRSSGVSMLILACVLALPVAGGCSQAGVTGAVPENPAGSGAGTPSTQPNQGRAGLDLTQLLVWAKQDHSEIVRRGATSNYRMVQTYYDRSGRRIDDLKLGYLFHGVWWCQFEISEGLVRVDSDDERNLIGYADTAGRVVIPFQYYSAAPFHDGRAVVAVNDSNDYRKRKGGLIDRQGQWVVRAGKYHDLKFAGQGRWAFMELGERHGKPGGPWGYLDANGNVVVDSVLTHEGRYDGGVSLVRDANGWQIMDRNGKIVTSHLPDNLDSAEDFSCGRALVFILTGKRRPAPAGIFGNSTEMQSDTRAGFMDGQGRMAIPARYIAAGSFTEGLAPVSNSKGARFTDSEDEQFSSAVDDPEHADPNQRWGFIDTEGRLVIPMKFDQVSQFREGLARARQGRKWGFIDRTGTFVVPPVYEWVMSFGNGVAMVVKDGMIFLVDKKGKVIVNTGSGYAVF
jgi:hypothetical protein